MIPVFMAASLSSSVTESAIVIMSLREGQSELCLARVSSLEASHTTNDMQAVEGEGEGGAWGEGERRRGEGEGR